MALQGHQAVHGGGHGSVCRVHVRGGGTWLHIVDGNAAWAEVAGKTASQAHNGGLAHGVDGSSRPWHTFRVGAADCHDPPAFAHVACSLLNADEYSAYVYGQCAVK